MRQPLKPGCVFKKAKGATANVRFADVVTTAPISFAGHRFPDFEQGLAELTKSPWLLS
jgi:hypothetical protein